MLSRDTIEFAHVTLGLVPKILNAIDVISSLCKELRMIDAEVLERADIRDVSLKYLFRVSTIQVLNQIRFAN